MNSDDMGKIARGEKKVGGSINDNQSALEQPHEQNIIIPSDLTPNQAVLQSADMGWLQGTQSLQRNLVRSLQDYKATRGERRELAAQRQRMIAEVTENYVNYLREEAKLASDAALKARDSILRQELARLRKELYVEIAEIAGTGVVEIEQIFQKYNSQITSEELRQYYAKFVWGKVLDLLEHPEA